MPGFKLFVVYLGRAEQSSGVVREPGVHHGVTDGIRLQGGLPGMEGITETLNGAREGLYQSFQSNNFNIVRIKLKGSETRKEGFRRCRRGDEGSSGKAHRIKAHKKIIWHL